MIKKSLLIGTWLLFMISNCAFAGLEQAEVSFLKGEYPDSIKKCDEIINMSQGQDKAAAYYLKAKSLIKVNKIPQAQQIFEKILSEFPGSRFSEEAQLGLGDIYFALNDYEKALGEYRKLQEKYPDTPFMAMALYRLGRSCQKLGRMNEARYYFQKLQQDYPLSFESKLIDELEDAQFAYSVQVGCFSKYENAEKLVNTLKAAGFDAYVSEKEGHPVFYRVRVGKFKASKDAESCRSALQKKGYKTKICP